MFNDSWQINRNSIWIKIHFTVKVFIHNFKFFLVYHTGMCLHLYESFFVRHKLFKAIYEIKIRFIREDAAGWRSRCLVCCQFSGLEKLFAIHNFGYINCCKSSKNKLKGTKRNVKSAERFDLILISITNK